MVGIVITKNNNSMYNSINNNRDLSRDLVYKVQIIIWSYYKAGQKQILKSINFNCNLILL